jgi:hypothetical protein
MAAAADPVSAIAGAAGEASKATAELFKSLGSIFGGSQQKKQEAEKTKGILYQSDAQKYTADAQVRLQDAMNSGDLTRGLLSLQAQRLDIQKTQVVNEGSSVSPWTWLVLILGFVLIVSVGIIIYKKV